MFRSLEIWKNTPVMSVHILAMILLSHPEETDINLKCQVLMSDFRQKFSSHFDLAFIGEIKHITNQALDIFLKTEMSFTSMAVDVMKFESFLSKGNYFMLLSFFNGCSFLILPVFFLIISEELIFNHH